jgi:GntR family transcriptional regulator/MocR family aminotransferase
MQRWDLALAIDDRRCEPVFLQIARGIADAALARRLRAHEPVPSSRALAASLGVHRNTVLAAYDELVAQGVLVTERARGTFVAELPPAPRRARRSPTSHGAASDAGLAAPGFAIRSVERTAPLVDLTPGTLALASGIPDLRLCPTEALARAWRRVLRRQPARLLGYGDERGDPFLRRALAAMLAARRGLTTAEDDVLIVRGSQMGLDLCARLLISPGDVVAVEALGYAPAFAALRAAGAVLRAIPVDNEGLDTRVLASLMANERVRAVYTTPHHQYPTTVTLSAARRIALLDLCGRHRVAILEDDYDHEFHYQGRPVLPLKSADHQGVVIYLGTLSKILAPGLRLGFVVAPRAVLAELAALRRHVDRQGDLSIERAAAELLDDGTVLRHARRMQRLYRTRRDALADALTSRFGDRLSFDLPRGGLAIWARASFDVDAWAERALSLGVSFPAAQRFALDGKARPAARLGFACLDEAEIREAVRRLLIAATPAHRVAGRR